MVGQGDHIGVRVERVAVEQIQGVGKEGTRHPLQLPVHQRGVAPEDGVAVEIGEQEGPGAEERRQPEEHSVDSQQTASRQPLRWRGGDLVGAMTVRRADRGRQRGDHSGSLMTTR